MRPIPIIAGIVLALGAVEAAAWWWMHPAPTGLDRTVLIYQPSTSAGVSPASLGTEISDQRSGGSKQETGRGVSPSTIDGSIELAEIPQPSTASTTPLPELYDKAAPMLRCSGGQVFHTQLDETLGLHLAFFEWNDSDTGSVLEAFRHLPEACMGSIGMTLISKEKPIHYQVGNQSLVFDHTIFREPAQGGGFAAQGPQVHAFRAIWVAGMADSNARQGIGGDEFDNLRAIRLKSALTRFRPSHARVIQGAVRGAANGDAAWQAFESAMLVDLKFQ